MARQSTDGEGLHDLFDEPEPQEETLPAVLPDDLFSRYWAQMVAELAMGLADAQTLRDRYSIPTEVWSKIKANPVFRSMLAEAVQTWTGEINAGQRITKKAEIVLEDAIPVVDGMIHNKDLPPSIRLDAMKLVESLTGRKSKDAVVGGGAGGFALNIFLNGQTMTAATIEGSATQIGEPE